MWIFLLILLSVEFIKSPAQSLKAHLPQNLARPVMTIGNFDGVHRGHMKLLSRVVKRARALNLPSLTMIFEPHPQEVIHRGNGPQRVLSLEEKVKLIGKTGLDYLVCIKFSREFARMTPSAFVRRLLVDVINPIEIFVGPNFTFGRGARGHVNDLIRLGGRYGFNVRMISTERIGKTTVSSTRIRSLLERGDVRGANRLLGYPYYIIGKVVGGAGRGKRLGIPTANLKSLCGVLVREGAYAVRAWVRGKPFAGAMNFGTRPTFKEKRQILEVFLLNFSGSIYGETVRVELLERIRGERAFLSASGLKAQIEKDVRRVKDIVRVLPAGEFA